MRAFVRQFLVVYFTFSSFFAHGAGFDWTPENRPPIRASIQDCKTFLVPDEPTRNDSVGVLLSTGQIDDFETQLDELIATRGEAAALGGQFFITGVPMGKEKQTRDLFETALAKRNLLRGGTKVTVMSIPKAEVTKLVKQTVSAVWDRLKYFMPSIARDYQTPLRGEVTTGIASDIAVEVPNVVFLYNTLPLIDANLAVTTHTVTLLAYIVYGKFMLNWLLRPGTGKIEGFLKSALLSFPFILNYSLFGNFSKIAGFYQQHGWSETLAAFPEQMANFGTTQGLTLFLQVLFYNVVMTNGVGAWQNSQEGTENSRLARTVSNIIRTPILAMDAIALAMAGGNANPLWSMGPFDVNSGHIALVGLSAIGSILYFKPNILNPTLRWYKGFQTIWKSFASAFKRPRPATQPNRGNDNARRDTEPESYGQE